MDTSAESNLHYSGCILYVDDDISITSVLEKIFEHFGYEFFVTTRPSEALSMVQSHPDRYDLVITDLNLPEMNGLDLAKEILNINTALPIVLCTGSYGLDAEVLREAGINTLLQKPFSMQDLENTIQRVFGDVLD